jgi:hypothetical protein
MRTRPIHLASLLCLSLAFWACSSSSAGPADAGQDSGTTLPDAGAKDGGQDSGTTDAGTDGGVVEDGGTDGGVVEDGGTDGGEQMDACATDNGGCDALTTCSSETDGGVVCGACPSGYSGDGVSGCADIDECTSIDPGCGGEECVNTEGGYLCVPPPASVMLREQGRSNYVGNDGASARWGQCPAGQVIVGYDFGQMTASPYKITAASPYCSELTLTGSSYSDVTVSTTLPTSTDSSSRVCPQDEVVTGLAANVSEGGYGIDVESIAVQCAPISVSLDGGTGPALTLGASHSLELFPSGGLAVNTSTGCPSGGVAYGINPAGAQWIFGLALRCAAPTFHGDLPAIAFDSPANTPVIGASQQDLSYMDLCPDGGVVSGLMLESQWRSFQVRCSTPVLDAAPEVPLMNPDTLPRHGSPAPSYEYGCGPSGAVTGFQTYASSTYLYELVFECASLSASADAGTWTVSVSSPEAGPRFGTAVTPDQSTRCPAGAAPIGMLSRTTTQSNGFVELSGVGLVCGTPTVP